MVHNKLVSLTVPLALLFVSPALQASEDSSYGLGVAAKVGTLGVGAELGYRINDYFALRVGYNTGHYDYEDETNPGNDFRLDLESVPAILDWHVFGGSFRVSAGYINNKNHASAVEQGVVEVGDNTYATTLTADVNYGNSASYVGIGWGALPSPKSGLGFSFEIGAMIQGDPEVTVTAPGVPQSDIDKQIATYEEDLDFPYWPVVVFGIGYTF
jgi:hypothetical protein